MADNNHMELHGQTGGGQRVSEKSYVSIIILFRLTSILSSRHKSVMGRICKKNLLYCTLLISDAARFSVLVKSQSVTKNWSLDVSRCKSLSRSFQSHNVNPALDR